MENMAVVRKQECEFVFKFLITNLVTIATQNRPNL